MDFPGKSRLVAALDAAVGHPSQEAVIAALGRTLAALFADPGFVLPPALLRPVHDHYARRELHVSPTLDYSVVAMTWAPGQGTPIHDHDGAWCTEIVWHGRLAITRYAPTERDGERWRFARIGSEVLFAGATDWLAPPHEYHAVHNPSAGEVAVSLHVYQRQLRRSHAFLPEPADGDGDGWMRRVERPLPVDPPG